LTLHYPAVGGATVTDIAEKVWTFLDLIGRKLTNLDDTRAARIDQITAARMSELDPANMPGDIDAILARLDNATFGLNALRTRILERLSKADFDTKLPDARAALIDQITAARMSELDPANIPGDIDLLLTRLSAVRATYLDYLNTKLPLMELEQPYVSTPSQVTLNTTGSDQSLGSRNITVALPSGATRRKAIALALIIVRNATDTEQDIDFNLKVAGATIFTQDDVVTFTAAKGTTVISITQDCTTQVTGDGAFAIEAEAQISAAQNVTFTVVYFLFVEYRMS